jgi:hypothetical protein
MPRTIAQTIAGHRAKNPYGPYVIYKNHARWVTPMKGMNATYSLAVGMSRRYPEARLTVRTADGKHIFYTFLNGKPID